MATESFFSNASLAYLASAGAGKDGKTYSIKPADGSGDFTFSRGSNLAATRVGPTGLIEKGRENLLLQSNQFDTSPWFVTGIDTPTSGQTGYDGSSDAWTLEKNGAYAYLYQDKSISGVQTFSFYGKAGTIPQARITINTSVVNVTAAFDLANGIDLGGSQNITSSIESVGNGWYRCSVTYNQGTTSRFRIYPADVGGDLSGTSGSIYIQDAQVEIGLAATDYIESGASTGKAGLLEDEPRFDYSEGATCPSLLLEPSRSNVLPYSEYFSASDWINNGVTITDNAAISPEGKTNAALLTGVSGGFGIVKFSTWTATNKVASCFAKSGTGNIFKIANVSAADRYVLFDLSDGTISEESAGWTGSIEDFGNGWYRCTAISNNETGTFSLGTTAASNSVYIYGAQLEAGTHPTSYIPTYGVSQTRAQDDCRKSAITSLIGQTEGTVYWEGLIVSSPTPANIASFNYTTNSSISLERQADGTIRARVWNGLVPVVGIVTSGTNYNANVKIAFAYKSGDTALYIDGLQIGTSSTAFTFSAALTEFNLGAGDVYFANPHKSEVKQALLFKTRLSDADLATLTTL